MEYSEISWHLDDSMFTALHSSLEFYFVTFAEMWNGHPVVLFVPQHRISRNVCPFTLEKLHINKQTQVSSVKCAVYHHNADGFDDSHSRNRTGIFEKKFLCHYSWHVVPIPINSIQQKVQKCAVQVLRRKKSGCFEIDFK